MKFFHFLFFIPCFLAAQEQIPPDNEGVSPQQVQEELDTAEADLKKAEEMFNPYYTGPIIAGSAAMIPQGYANVQPYVYVTDNYAEFNSHHHSVNTPDKIVLNPLVVFQTGITHWLDLSVIAQGFVNWQQGECSGGIGDTALQIGFPLARQTLSVPDIKLILRETFPSGRYNHLNAKSFTVEQSGEGSYQSLIGINVQKTFFWWASHPLRLRFNGSYTIPSMVSVRGFNAYGGGYGTNARVHPGNNWLLDGAFELSIDQHWVFACDVLYTYANKTSFSGTQGTLANGSPAPLGNPSNYSWSLAPAIEYNWNESLGILVGPWFTVAGRNTANFVSGIFSVNYFYQW